MSNAGDERKAVELLIVLLAGALVLVVLLAVSASRGSVSMLGGRQ